MSRVLVGRAHESPPEPINNPPKPIRAHKEPIPNPFLSQECSKFSFHTKSERLSRQLSTHLITIVRYQFIMKKENYLIYNITAYAIMLQIVYPQNLE